MPTSANAGSLSPMHPALAHARHGVAGSSRRHQPARQRRRPPEVAGRPSAGGHPAIPACRSIISSWWRAVIKHCLRRGLTLTPLRTSGTSAPITPTCCRSGGAKARPASRELSCRARSGSSSTRHHQPGPRSCRTVRAATGAGQPGRALWRGNGPITHLHPRRLPATPHPRDAHPSHACAPDTPAVGRRRDGPLAGPHPG
jgi:hypothetical protein